ncbi:MAG: helix-turn-helix domain-containing protein [Firmicutes bacterium]|nr:helix-turn-helix domain-containing protein [Bacillota bacterium]
MGVLSDRLRERRERKGLKQTDVARLLKVTSQTISAYELETRQPDHAMLSKLADLYGTNVEYLLGRTDDPRPSAKAGPIPETVKDPNIAAIQRAAETLGPEQAVKVRAMMEILVPDAFEKSAAPKTDDGQ